MENLSNELSDTTTTVRAKKRVSAKTVKPLVPSEPVPEPATSLPEVTQTATEAPPERKRRRKKQSNEEYEARLLAAKGVTTTIIAAAGSITATTLPPPLTEEEQAALTAVWAPIVAEYEPDPVWVAIAVTATIFLPRLISAFGSNRESSTNTREERHGKNNYDESSGEAVANCSNTSS